MAEMAYDPVPAVLAAAAAVAAGVPMPVAVAAPPLAAVAAPPLAAVAAPPVAAGAVYVGPAAAAAAPPGRVPLAQVQWPDFIPPTAMPQNLDITEPRQDHVRAEAQRLQTLAPIERANAVHMVLWDQPLLAARVLIELDGIRRRALTRAAANARAQLVRSVRRAIRNGRRVAVDPQGVVLPAP